jgi:hypothetical protein
MEECEESWVYKEGQEQRFKTKGMGGGGGGPELFWRTLPIGGKTHAEGACGV